MRIGTTLLALGLALSPELAFGEQPRVDWTVFDRDEQLPDQYVAGAPAVGHASSAPLVAGFFFDSAEEKRQFELFLYSVFGVTGFTIVFNGTHAISRDRSPTFFRVLGGVLGTIELVPGVLFLISPDARDAGAILTSLGGTAVLAALLSGGKKKDKTVLVSPTSDGGAVMSMSWRF